MCSLYTCMSLGNRSCENIGNMHLFPTEVAKREAVVLPGARWAWMGPVVKCCSQTQHRLQMCFRSTCAKCISVHLEGSWYWACRQITTQDKGHKVHGCLPRCVIFQISIQEPPHISVAENPTPQCGLLERWHVLFTSQPVFFTSLQYCWRWTGFNFGFDLLVTYTNRYIIFKRNTLNQPCSGSVSLQPRRNIAFR